jgi:hypothetical protein
MSDLFDNGTPDELTPEDLARAAFERCSNWPADRRGQLGLAQGLKLASKRFGLTMEEIIAAAKEASAFCPTDFDLLKLAGEIREVRHAQENASRNLHAEWEAAYGPPTSVPWTAEDDRAVKAAIAIRDKRERDTKAELIRRRGTWPGWAKIEWREIYLIWRDLGFKLNSDQEEIAAPSATRCTAHGAARGPKI